MRLCVVGAGYVGLVSGACLADVGNTVWCVDKDGSKVKALKEGRIPIYEPGLEEIVRRNWAKERLFFTTDLKVGLESAEICFITVDTPLGADGCVNLTNVFAVAGQIGEVLGHGAIIVVKSTVPVGTTPKVGEVVMNGLRARGIDPSSISWAFNPEFLKEGAAVEDFMKPDRVIVGVEDEGVGKKLRQLYAPFMRRRDKFLQMDIASAELAKYAANAMLATRISFMNEMARLCEVIGADIGEIKRAIGSDPRIGPDFLYAGLGYGGSCLPKDTKAVVRTAAELGISLPLTQAVGEVNDTQCEWFWQKIKGLFETQGGLKGKKVGVWGLAFKANTDDVRFAPSLYIIEHLLGHGADVAVYDPAATENAKATLGGRATGVVWAKGAYDVLEGADALVICTEWREFRSPNFARMKRSMRSPVIFDGRNLYDPATMKNEGFRYVGIGRGSVVNRES